jgi:hypothetical protein
MIARSMEAYEPKNMIGLDRAQVGFGLSQAYNVGAMTRAQGYNLERAPIFYGRAGARNPIETAQALLDVEEAKRGGSVSGMIFDKNMTPDEANLAFNRSIAPQREGVEQARLNFPRVANNELILSADARLRGTQEEIAAQKAITDHQKIQLHVLQEKHKLESQGLEMTKEQKAEVDADKELDKESRMNRLREGMKATTGAAFTRLLSDNGADKFERGHSLRDEDYRWGQQPMDMLDRGIGRGTKEYKTAQRRHDELQHEMREQGGVKAFGKEIIGGWADNSRKMVAEAVNEKLWSLAGPTMSKIFGGKDKEGEDSDKNVNTKTMTVHADNIYMNGQNTGSGSFNIGGGNDGNQKLDALATVLGAIRNRK